MNTISCDGNERTGVGAQWRDGEQSEPPRNEGPTPVGKIPYMDPEVPAKAKRRRFSAAYKLQILQEADACTNRGEIGELLRREGLYSSRLTSWRNQRNAGAFGALNEKRGRKRTDVNPLQKQVDGLEKNNNRLERQLKKAQLIIDFQKKAAEIMQISLGNPEERK